MNVQTSKQPPYVIFLTGASGAGKTALLESFNQEMFNRNIACLHFDSIGVPSEKEMIEQYGSGSAWQKAMTLHWIEKALTEFQHKRLVLIEGQVNLSFIEEAFKKYNIAGYKIVLVHCDNIIRHNRLYHNRKQAELINPQMDNWSGFLKKQTIEMHASILDTTQMSMKQAVDWLKNYIRSINI